MCAKGVVLCVLPTDKKTGFTFSADNKYGAESGSSFSTRNRSENFPTCSAEIELETIVGTWNKNTCSS